MAVYFFPVWTYNKLFKYTLFVGHLVYFHF